MNLGEYISYLETKDLDTAVKLGLGNPHSWRGIYAELAFEPVENTTVGKMLEEAKSVIGITYTGWKGGDYMMSLETKVNIEYEGCYSDGNTAMKMLLDLITGKL
jgi:hypothetical protein